MKLLRQIRGMGDNSDKKIGCFDLWKKVFLDSKNKDDSNYFNMRDYNLYSNGSDLYSGRDNLVYFYSIDGYPKELPIDFKEAIRNEAKEGVKISFASTFDVTRIHWESAQMRSRLKTWKTIDDDAEDVDEFNYRENIKLLDNNTWRKQSLLYLSDAEIRRKRKLFKYRSMMVISGVRGTNFEDTVIEVQEACSAMGLNITRVEGDLDDFLRCFSPFSLESDDKMLKKVGNTTIPDEMIARFSTYDQGKVGRRGTIWGNDIYSGFPVFKQFKKTDVDAENILITGETGGGKSYFGKALFVQLLADPLFNGTIMDIEGFEYLPLAGFFANNDKVVVLNMAEGQGKYFDPVEIHLTGNRKLDDGMFAFSKSFTLSVMKTLLGDGLSQNDWTSVIINDAVAKTYGSRGVTLDMKTWGNSKGLTLHDVYQNAKKLYKEVLNPDGTRKDLGGLYRYLSDKDVDFVQAYKLNTGYKDALDIVIAKLSVYFEPLERGGTRSDVFKNRVSLNDVRDAKLVVCSFGMAGKSATTVDPIQMALTQLSAANISHLRSLFSKNEGKFNFKVWEEFQRWGSFPDAETTIKTALTGGRKLGDVNFIVTNDLKELLDHDRFAIFGNITSFAIGAIDDEDIRRRVCERLTIPLLKPELDKLVLNKGNNETFSSEEGSEEVRSIYDKAFLIRLDKSVSTITRMELPSYISKSTLFRTGTQDMLEDLAN